VKAGGFYDIIEAFRDEDPWPRKQSAATGKFTLAPTIERKTPTIQEAPVN
jgi:hypothetical protein